MIVEATTLLNQIAAAPLFQHVGEPIHDPQVVTVADWPAAMSATEKNSSVNFGTRIMNRIFARAIEDRGSDWFNRHWNKMIVPYKKEIERPLKDVLQKTLRRHKLPVRFKCWVIGDVLQACLLLEFPDEPSRGWNDRIMRWYFAGHFPCGYKGRLPGKSGGRSADELPEPDVEGKLIVH
jgi:hypothetical protein